MKTNNLCKRFLARKLVRTAIGAFAVSLLIIMFYLVGRVIFYFSPLTRTDGTLITDSVTIFGNATGLGGCACLFFAIATVLSKVLGNLIVENLSRPR